MKTISLIILILLMCGCGDNKKNSSNPNSFSNALTTLNGYYTPQANILEVGGQTYPAQQYMAQLQMAKQSAYNIQPVNVNGVLKYRVYVTGQISQSGMSSGYYPSYNPYQSLIITQIRFY
jgi:hypothetical protein